MAKQSLLEPGSSQPANSTQPEITPLRQVLSATIGLHHSGMYALCNGCNTTRYSRPSDSNIFIAYHSRSSPNPWTASSALDNSLPGADPQHCNNFPTDLDTLGYESSVSLCRIAITTVDSTLCAYTLNVRCLMGPDWLGLSNHQLSPSHL